MRNELGQQTGLRHGGGRIAGQIMLNGRSQVPSEIPELGGRTVGFEFEQKTTAAKPLDETKIEVREAGEPFRPSRRFPHFVEMQCAAPFAKSALSEMRHPIGQPQEIERRCCAKS